MNGWILVLGIAGVCLLWLIIRWLYIDPAHREHESQVRKCFDEQARKRNGNVEVRQGRTTLTVPHKTVNIELALVEDKNEPSLESTYARFRTEAFADKKFRILFNSKDVWQKPLVFGTRLQVADEKFRANYIATGDDASFVDALLTPEIRDKLLAEPLHVKFGRRLDSSRLSQERGWLSVFTPGLRASDKIHDSLIDTAILFYDRLEALDSQTNSQLTPQ